MLVTILSGGWVGVWVGLLVGRGNRKVVRVCVSIACRTRAARLIRMGVSLDGCVYNRAALGIGATYMRPSQCRTGGGGIGGRGDMGKRCWW